MHLIYRAQPYEGIAKDFEFSRRTMEEHWRTGYSNARQTLANPEVLQLPNRLEGVRTFDIGQERGLTENRLRAEFLHCSREEIAMKESDVRARAFAMPLTKEACMSITTNGNGSVMGYV